MKKDVTDVIPQQQLSEEFFRPHWGAGTRIGSRRWHLHCEENAESLGYLKLPLYSLPPLLGRRLPRVLLFACFSSSTKQGSVLVNSTRVNFHPEQICTGHLDWNLLTLVVCTAVTKTHKHRAERGILRILVKLGLQIAHAS